ncbi:hypothetical protein C8255_18765, partial [filamentous cyanobacterium CCP3]
MRWRLFSLTIAIGGFVACGAVVPLRLLSAVPDIPEAEATAQPKAFSDTHGHWAETEINALDSRNIISGFPDGRFKPNAPVTRAEFAAMVNQAFRNRDSTQPARNFSDVPSNYWASEAIRRAVVLGFIAGYPDGTFRPEGNISRVEAVVALASGLQLAGSTDPGSLYSDAAQIPSWARDQVSRATYNGIRIKGPNANQFRPMQSASRADIAVFVYQALQRYPIAGVITHLDPPAGAITLDEASAREPGFAVRLQLMERNTQVLRVPTRAIANIGFRPAIGSGTISHSDYLVQAGPTA